MSDAVLQAAQALIARLEEMEKPLNDAIVFRAIHGIPYAGPYWGDPLDALRLAVEVAKREAEPLSDPEADERDAGGQRGEIGKTSLLSDQDVLLAIEHICGDDFCEDMNCRDHLSDEFANQPKMQTAIRKLTTIYRLSHAFVRSNSCYGAHDSWRAECPSAKREAEPLSNPEVTGDAGQALQTALVSTTLGDDLLAKLEAVQKEIRLLKIDEDRAEALMEAQDKAIGSASKHIDDLLAKLRVATEALEDAKKALRPFAAISMPDVVQWFPDRYAKIETQSGDVHSAVKCSAKIDAALAQIRGEG